MPSILTCICAHKLNTHVRIRTNIHPELFAALRTTANSSDIRKWTKTNCSISTWLECVDDCISDDSYVVWDNVGIATARNERSDHTSNELWKSYSSTCGFRPLGEFTYGQVRDIECASRWGRNSSAMWLGDFELHTAKYTRKYLQAIGNSNDQSSQQLIDLERLKESTSWESVRMLPNIGDRDELYVYPLSAFFRLNFSVITKTTFPRISPHRS